MLLDEECKGCLYKSQLNKVEREKGQDDNLVKFKTRVALLCENPPKNYCAPLLMRDIDAIHREIYGSGIDYSRERTLFNCALLKLEEGLFATIMRTENPLTEAMKYAMAANYIDFARLSDLDESAISLVMQSAARAVPNPAVIKSLENKLKNAATLLYIHDNCGEIVLDKILIRTIKKLYPQIEVISVVRGSDIINDVTKKDAEQIGLYSVAKVIDNGTNVPGTFLKEVSPEVLTLLDKSDVIISKGLGNLETLYGEGYEIFYSFTCKCGHIAEKFNAPLWSAVLAEEKI